MWNGRYIIGNGIVPQVVVKPFYVAALAYHVRIGIVLSSIVCKVIGICHDEVGFFDQKGFESFSMSCEVGLPDEIVTNIVYGEQGREQFFELLSKEHFTVIEQHEMIEASALGGFSDFCRKTTVVQVVEFRIQRVVGKHVDAFCDDRRVIGTEVRIDLFQSILFSPDNIHAVSHPRFT